MTTKLVELRDVIMIDLMTDIDTITFLKKKLDTFFDDDDLRELVYILEYILLAIVQKTAYIRQKKPKYNI